MRHKEPWKHKYTKVLLYSEKGMETGKIAKKVGYCRARIAQIRSMPEYKDRKAKFDETVIDKARKVFEEAAVEAAQKVVSLGKHGKSTQRIQLEASREVLHQVGLKPAEVIETTSREYTPEEIESAYATVQELEDTANRLIDNDSQFLLDKTEVKREEDVVKEPAADGG